MTWAKRQTMTAQFLATYCDEAYAWIDPLRYNAVTGLTQQKFNNSELTSYITQIVNPPKRPNKLMRALGFNA